MEFVACIQCLKPTCGATSCNLDQVSLADITSSQRLDFTNAFCLRDGGEQETMSDVSIVSPSAATGPPPTV